MTTKYKMMINAELVDSDETYAVINPANEEVIGQAPIATENQLNQAVDSAANAFHKWGKPSNKEARREKLLECQKALSEYTQEIAELLTLEQGKPLKAALGEVSAGISEILSIVNYPLFHEVLQDDESKKVEMEQLPFGVVAAITPWNYPVYIALTKIAAALWSGNTVVLKPSEYTPLTTLKIGMILKDILPKGVLNIVSGKGEVGSLLVEHPKVAKVSFTGSVPTGKKIAQACAKDLKRVTLELGGNDAGIVLENTPIQEIVNKIFWGAFVNCGQICVAIKRLYVHESQVEEFASALNKLAELTKIGNGMNEDTEIGPINNIMQYEKVKDYFNQAKSAGAKIWGGGPVEGQGYFFKPSIVTGLSDGHPLVDEEQFGPILPIIAYKNLDDAIQSANQLNVGLAGSVWGTDKEKVDSVANQMQSGTVWVNTVHNTHEDACFGGVKQSGIGREGGPEGLKSFGEIKVTVHHKFPA
jgi:acyl-CoA reductase-like NAD-dependent aldehyde dehydrogenase